VEVHRAPKVALVVAFEVHVASTSSDEPVGPTRDHPTPLGIRTCRFQGD
jgi:hypothetical protein